MSLRLSSEVSVLKQRERGHRASSGGAIVHLPKHSQREWVSKASGSYLRTLPVSPVDRRPHDRALLRQTW